MGQAEHLHLKLINRAGFDPACSHLSGRVAFRVAWVGI